MCMQKAATQNHKGKTFIPYYACPLNSNRIIKIDQKRYFDIDI